MNDHLMRVTILGSGTGVPSLRRSACSLLVEAGAATLLFDVGAGTIRRLLENRTRLEDITHLCLSHFHPDHSGELASFLFALRNPALHRDGHHLTLIGGPGFTDFFKALKQVFGRWIDLGPQRMSLVELGGAGPDRITAFDLVIRTAPVRHNAESLAFRVERKGRVTVYSGDTDHCESLIDLARNADLFVCESACPDHLKTDGHLTPSLAGDIARRAGVKVLVLTHFYPECDKTDIAKACRKTYDGKLFAAEDLMRFDVG
ncbi:MBL fold metallo-hydrolase [Desulfatiferula olefinivorans]